MGYFNVLATRVFPSHLCSFTNRNMKSKKKEKEETSKLGEWQNVSHTLSIKIIDLSFNVLYLLNCMTSICLYMEVASYAFLVNRIYKFEEKHAPKK